MTEPILANSNPVAGALYENMFMCTDSQSCWPGSDYNVHEVQGDVLSLAYTAYGRSRVHPDFKAFGSIQSSTAYCANPNDGVYGPPGGLRARARACVCVCVCACLRTPQ